MVSPWIVDGKCRAGIGGYYSHICKTVTGYTFARQYRVDKPAGMTFILAGQPGADYPVIQLTDSEPIVLRL
jgi:hypothetical protein